MTYKILSIFKLITGRLEAAAAEVASSTRASAGAGAATPARARKAPPKFYSTPHNKIAEPGETVRFQCNVGGCPSPRVTWDRDNIAIKASARFRLVEERDDVRILEIRNVTIEVHAPSAFSPLPALNASKPRKQSPSH